jgi:fructosamine-3-kinase
MISPDVHQQILQLIRQSEGNAVSSLRFFPVGGGSINDTYEVQTNAAKKFFCKVNSHSKFPGLFEAERQGLELLQAQRVIRIPRVYGSFVMDDSQVLVMEWIGQGKRTAGFWQLFGQQLAALHFVEDRLFGLGADNYMGSLPQKNQQSDKWKKFFISQRLEPQIILAVENGLLSAKEAAQFEKVYVKLKDIFPFSVPRLLHGDLWSGNFVCDEQNRPVLIDPAVYYGHPAIDLGMTTLFGGFDTAFYDSYRHYLPFPPNYHEQWEVCNLYPLLIHLNLFGESYKSAIINTIRRY